ncbi:MAG: DNA translocase FtsK [Bacteroidaceae bacterium]|nr:DNA translocase FtsK [Bacteroidaceae bacterium]
MADTKRNKSEKNSKSRKGKEKGRLRQWLSSLWPGKKVATPATREKENAQTTDVKKDEKKRQQHSNRRFVIGALFVLLAVYILLAMVSHLFTGDEDQRLMSNPAYIAANWMGKWGYHLAHYLMDNWFGVASMFIPIMMIATGIRIMGVARIRLHKWLLNCMVLMIWCSAFAAYVVAYVPFARDSYIIWGGMIGREELELMRSHIGPAGVVIALLMCALLYLAYVSDEAIGTLRGWMTTKEMRGDKGSESLPTGENAETESVETEHIEGELEGGVDDEAHKPFEDNPADTATVIDFGKLPTGHEQPLRPGEQELPLDIVPTESEMEIVQGKEPEKADLGGDGTLEPYDPKLDLEYYKYPTLDLLKKYETTGGTIDMAEQQANKTRILQVLSTFGVEISNIKATIGPAITLYEVTPAPGVRIAKIRNLEDDIALSLSALGIRIIAPIPGKGTIGIEVPNAKPQMVSMESILNSRKFQETEFELPMALGKTITNEVFMVDLAKMPHLLVAGATGQGKSVGLNAIITSLLYKKHPAELKLVMVDPKKVEFSVYNPIVNHFLAQVEGNEDTEEPIITDVNKVIQTLKSLCVEMDTRYDLLKKARARNVKEYNEKFKNRELNPNNGHKFMPYIVVVIDEFGDLIMTAGKEIELPIARIAQLARAVGIHMIIATQRPTTNIITGTIKANFPARMAFKVMSVVDSRTILDRTGANQLVGKGDMLFLSGTEPIRVQCAFVDTPEVENIVSYIACQQSYNHPFPLPEVAMEGDSGGDSSDVDMNHLDPMFEEAARMVVIDQNGSTSMLQRKFCIGFARAGRLMDQLEKAGIVGPSRGAKPREVLCVSEDDLQMRLASLR